MALKPYRQPIVVRNVQLKLPASLPSGSYPLSVLSGSSANPSSGSLSILAALLGGRDSGGNGGSSYSATVRQLVKRYLERPRNDEMILRLSLPTPAVNVQGEKLTNLPPTLENALRNARTSSVRNERDELKETFGTDYVLSGAQTVVIRVARKNEPDRSFFPSSPSSDAPSVRPASPPGSGDGVRPVPPNPADDEDFATAFRTQSPPQLLNLPVSDGDDNGDLQIRAANPAEPPSDEVRTPNLTPTKGGADSDVKSVTRAPGLWQQVSAQDFRAGIAKGVAITSAGEVRLARKLTKLAESDVPLFLEFVR